MAGWRGTCRALNWVCMLYRWLAGALVMIAVSRWPWWQLHAGRPRPACLFLSGPGTLSRQLLSPTLITPSYPPSCLATPSQPLHNTSVAPQCNPQSWKTTSSVLPWEKRWIHCYFFILVFFFKKVHPIPICPFHRMKSTKALWFLDVSPKVSSISIFLFFTWASITENDNNDIKVSISSSLCLDFGETEVSHYSYNLPLTGIWNR